MKETVNVNIGSQAFIVDADAYGTLRSYFDDIRSRLPEDDAETMNDIESRVAEIFRERLSSPMRVVTIDLVRETMSRMGAPRDFGERRGDCTPPASGAANSRKLRRSRSDRSIAGICGGLGAFFGIDPTLVRIVTLLLIFLGGLSVWVYVILWIVIPDEPLCGADPKTAAGSR